ncbi:MAG: flagellar hook protein FlgE [Thermoleophilaceae bacterium]|nr:flagellar hook protein FlgE [Thermoleophilaceae bacterium]
MMRSMFAAISGLKQHQTMLDVTANDIANVNTLGYKANRVTFKDSLSQLQRGGAAQTAGQGGQNPAQVGLGVSLSSIDAVMGGGASQSTGNVLDVAVQGEGWFRVGQGTPPTVPAQLEYTRAGNFSRNDQGYLVTQDGYFVVGRTAAGGGTDTLLQIPTGATNVAIAQDGSVSYVPLAGGARVTSGFLSLAKFANEPGLQRDSSNRWLGSPASGPEVVGTPGTTAAGTWGVTTAGTVEMSNVDLATEFTNMITAQRGFQANSRVISAADDMLQELVNMKH